MAITSAAAAMLVAVAAVPAQARTEPSGAGPAATVGGSSYQIDDLVAMRKQQMSHDFIAYAAARARWAEHLAAARLDGPRMGKFGVGGSGL
jgi:hypothetical protein